MEYMNLQFMACMDIGPIVVGIYYRLTMQIYCFCSLAQLLGHFSTDIVL